VGARYSVELCVLWAPWRITHRKMNIGLHREFAGKKDSVPQSLLSCQAEVETNK
jgi:hypothetical protein